MIPKTNYCYRHTVQDDSYELLSNFEIGASMQSLIAGIVHKNRNSPGHQMRGKLPDEGELVVNHTKIWWRLIK